MNRSNRFSIIIFISLFFLLLFQTVYADDPLKTQKTVCLDAKRCDEAPCTGHGITNKWHTARLTTQSDVKLYPNKQAYIITCVGGSTDAIGQVCTTGNSALDLDRNIYNHDNVEELRKAYGYKFEGLYLGSDGVSSPNGPGNPPNPVTTKADGDIDPLQWQDYTPTGKARLYKAMFLFDPTEEVGAAGAGVKQNDLDFDSAGKACVKVSWDPKGRVFDWQTLEPIKGVNVKLSRNKKYPTASISDSDFEVITVLDGKIYNQFYTKNDGKYEFTLPDGDYKIVIDLPLVIATDPAQIHSAYSKAYYDLYDGSPILQRGAIEHRDVAIKTAAPYTTTDLALYDYFVERGGAVVTVSGRVSHPLSLVSVNTAKSTDMREPITKPITHLREGIASAKADREGNFSVAIDQAILNNTDEYQELVSDVTITKVRLTDAPVAKVTTENRLITLLKNVLRKFVPFVHGQVTSLKLNIPSMPTYLSGYAKDSNGNVIPNAKVGLYLTFSETPSHVVQTDSTGYFHVVSENIPDMPFNIRFTTPTGQVVTTSTANFIAENHEANVQNNTSPFEYRDKNNTPITPPVVKTSQGASSQRSGTNPSGPVNQNGTSTNPAVTQTLIVLVLLILLLGGVGVAVLLYMKNKTPQQGTF